VIFLDPTIHMDYSVMTRVMGEIRWIPLISFLAIGSCISLPS
jgi:hypothetical protein